MSLVRFYITEIINRKKWEVKIHIQEYQLNNDVILNFIVDIVRQVISFRLFITSASLENMHIHIKFLCILAPRLGVKVCSFINHTAYNVGDL